MANSAIGTAENWQQLRTVTPIRRLFAHLIDTIVWTGSSFWLFSVISRADGSPEEMGGEFIASILLVLVFLIVSLVLFAKGRTVGKWLMGIKIIKNNGDTAGFGTVVMRDIVGKAISAAVLYLGFLWILLDSRNQGWHDKLMGTTVVYAKEHEALTEQY